VAKYHQEGDLLEANLKAMNTLVLSICGPVL